MSRDGEDPHPRRRPSVGFGSTVGSNGGPKGVNAGSEKRGASRGW